MVLGEHNRGADEGTEKIIDVVEVILHENYNRSITDNDMALFRLAEDVQYTRSIKPICLPRDDVTDNMMCITAGWGHTLCESAMKKTELFLVKSLYVYIRPTSGKTSGVSHRFRWVNDATSEL